MDGNCPHKCELPPEQNVPLQRVGSIFITYHQYHFLNFEVQQGKFLPQPSSVSLGRRAQKQGLMCNTPWVLGSPVLLKGKPDFCGFVVKQVYSQFRDSYILLCMLIASDDKYWQALVFKWWLEGYSFPSWTAILTVMPIPLQHSFIYCLI